MDLKKKILMICPQPFLILRGTPSSILNKIKVFQSLQYQIYLLIPNCSPVENHKEYISETNLYIIKTPKFYYLKVFKPGLSIYKFILFPFFTFQAIYLCLKNNFEFIFCLEDGIVYGLILKCLFKKKIIYRVHTLPSHYPTNNFILKNILTFFEFIFCYFSDAIAVINHFDELKIKYRYNQNVHNIYVIPAINNENITTSNQPIISNENKFTILWYGNTEKYQNFDLFLKIIEILQNDDNFYFIICSNDIINLKNFKNVQILKINEISNFEDIFNKVNLCVSFRDENNTFPSKLTVFMKYHKAILALNNQMHNLILKHNENAYLVPKDINAIIEAIKYLQNNLDKIKLFEEKIKELYEKEFNFEKYKKGFINLINSLKK